MPSDIQVFVRWRDQTIFAGEDVECTITFKNVAESGSDVNHGEQLSHQRRQSRPATSHSESLFSLKSPFSQNRRTFPTSPSNKKPLHRISSSLNSPWFGSHSFPPSSTPSTPRHGPPPNHKHKRSISILSIDSEGAGEKAAGPSVPYSRPKPARGHGRSASLQVPPRRVESFEDSFAKAGRHPVRGHLPTKSPIPPPPATPNVNDDRPRPTRPGSNANSPVKLAGSPRTPSRRPQFPPIDFKFPPAPPASESNHIQHSASPSIQSGDENFNSSKPAKSNTPTLPVPPTLPQLTRITSTSSLSGSNRNSGEFYSVSGNSSETLQSEYTNYSLTAPRIDTPRHARHFSNVESFRAPRSHSLLMGYAQVSASFTVDGSLVNQSAFEEVKRKGMVGGQSNGAGTSSGRAASGTDKNRKGGGGFWGALRWNTIEESISGLLSNNELDGLREMRGVASSKSIPLLSTSQSLLFVDLRLAPGEERSYSFTFTLPSGLPASHKGKAIKISYNLIIGTQRPSVPNEPQRVQRISIPFRVFNGVDGHGNVLGHDLMSPYVLLRDEARVQSVGSSPPPISKQKSISTPMWTSPSEFLSYVDEILEQHPGRDTLRPPDSLKEKPRSPNRPKAPLSCKDAIDMAILRSNRASSSMRSPNRFEIARNGRRIAVVVLNRPAHRLGETIVATVDFADAALPCYAIRATLETSEKVDPLLAVRSSSSIYRATRRIHASFFENTLYSTRVVFSPAIPISATPTALTSGVSLQWELRFEFVTPTSHGDVEPGPSGTGLLEATTQDDRGSVLSALEYLGCESFEVAIPLTVYGETVRERLPEESEGYSI